MEFEILHILTLCREHYRFVNIGANSLRVWVSFFDYARFKMVYIDGAYDSKV